MKNPKFHEGDIVTIADSASSPLRPIRTEGQITEIKKRGGGFLYLVSPIERGTIYYSWWFGSKELKLKERG